MHQNTASDAEWQYSGLPDLSAVQAEFSAGPSEPLYYTKMNLDSQEECQGVSEALAFKGGQEFDLNPIVFIRSKKTLTSAAVLPQIDIASLFTKAEGESSQIAFTVKNKVINMREIEQIEVSDPSTTELLEKVKTFKSDEDEQILSQLDKQIASTFESKDINNLSVRNFEITKDLFRKESSLQTYELAAIVMRTDLLLKFNKSFKNMIKYVNISQRKQVGSLSNMHYMCKSIALTSVINSMVDKQLKAIQEGGKPEINVSRRKAMQFQDDGNIDHEGKYSIFG